MCTVASVTFAREQRKQKEIGLLPKKVAVVGGAYATEIIKVPWLFYECAALVWMQMTS